MIKLWFVQCSPTSTLCSRLKAVSSSRPRMAGSCVQSTGPRVRVRARAELTRASCTSHRNREASWCFLTARAAQAGHPARSHRDTLARASLCIWGARRLGPGAGRTSAALHTISSSVMVTRSVLRSVV